MSRRELVTPDGPPVAIRQRGRGGLELAPVPAAVRAFHRSMPGYRETPLRQAPSAAEALGVREVWVKDESSRLGLPSFKILGASWAGYRALVEQLGSTPEKLPTFGALALAVEKKLRPFKLAAATDGNHGAAVARMAALLGLDAHIFVPDNTVAARIDAIRAEGAEVTVVAGGYDDAIRLSALEAGDRCLVISDTSWDGYERVPAWVIEGYSTILAEIDEALSDEARLQPDFVVVPVGVGAFAAAVVRHFANVAGPRLIAVEPTWAACVLESVAAGEITTLSHPQNSIMAGLNCATPSLIAWPIVSRGFDLYLAVDDARVPRAMRILARDGIVSGETGAAALAGMLAIAEVLAPSRQALALAPSASVLLFCTEGATDPVAYERLVKDHAAQ